MIRINQIKMPIQHSREELRDRLCRILRIPPEELLEFCIRKQSIDARRRQELSFVYTVDVRLKNEERILKKNKNPQIALAHDAAYRFPEPGDRALTARPVVIGSGPAGMFCAYALALHGYQPVVLERGRQVEERSRIVSDFWEGGELDTGTNVQFGEGGAGTFSDGKLNTLVKDVAGRNRRVLEILVELGAPGEILYQNKPHIGTDILKNVVANMRAEIQRLGGSYCFRHQVTGLVTEPDTACENRSLQTADGRFLSHEAGRSLRGLTVRTPEGEKFIPAETAVLAIGHSARDTFQMLQEQGIAMEAKAFAVGMRVEHPQSMIDECQYKGHSHPALPAASYKLTANTPEGRGVYSFCMCPGGYVVNASSEQGMLAVNGMSYHARDGQNANSAIIVSVTPEDFPGEGPLRGIAFQRELERRAAAAGGGRIPQQLYGDYRENRVSGGYGEFDSRTKGDRAFANLRDIFPEAVNRAFIAGMETFPRYIPDFNRYDAILSGVESRTSSPVRIHRNEAFESNVAGLYPCGEGAGYAGGIMSAAMDGLKVAEAIAGRYHTEGYC